MLKSSNVEWLGCAEVSSECLKSPALCTTCTKSPLGMPEVVLCTASHYSSALSPPFLLATTAKFRVGSGRVRGGGRNFKTSPLTITHFKISARYKNPLKTLNTNPIYDVYEEDYTWILRKLNLLLLKIELS